MQRNFYLYIVAICVIYCTKDLKCQPKSTPIVDLPLGKVEGFMDKTLEGRDIFSFEGVPYAKPPLGKHRFKPSIPPKPWHHVWKANTIYRCIQKYQYTKPGQDFVLGDEDCLYVNIYTPKLAPDANMDVIVYIHGGAFMFNHGGLQQPHHLLDRDVVLVTLNYRLGPMGFLSTESEIVPGNMGLKDQILALEFVQKYVKYFGGNPKSVTITGMSAGGASVQLHYMSPKSKGLFHRGISQSGTALNAWVLMEKGVQKTRRLGAVVGCTPNDESNMQGLVECLRKRPARQIIEAIDHFQPWLYNPFSPFGVVIDGPYTSDPVLPDHPLTLLKEKKIADLPWMISHTNGEGLYPTSEWYVDEKHLQDLDTRWNELMPLVLDFNYTADPSIHHTIGEMVREHYLKDRQVNRKHFSDLVKIFSDRLFIVDIHKAAKLHAAAAKSPVYFYYFTYRGAHSKSELTSGTDKNFGAAHGDDTSYVFRTNVNTTTTKDDQIMIKIFVEIFTTFAKSGVPGISADWPPMFKSVDQPVVYLQIDSPKKMTVEAEELNVNANFWESLNLKENEKFFALPKDEL